MSMPIPSEKWGHTHDAGGWTCHGWPGDHAPHTGIAMATAVRNLWDTPGPESMRILEGVDSWSLSYLF